MLDLLYGASGERLTRAEFKADYGKRFASAGSHDSWKLERLQNFREPENPAWKALVRGDWDDALRLIGEQRADLEEMRRDVEARGIGLYRVRVVEEPVVPYVQWELHYLLLAAEYGETTRVITPLQVEEFETDRPLPELLTVGDDTAYCAFYDENGACTGASRFIGVGIVAQCVEFIDHLYSEGEELSIFFQRRIAHMEPPVNP